MKSKRIDEIYLIRAFAMIAVVMIHATSIAVVNLGINSSLYGFYQFLNVFSTFAVPVFIFLSGFVLFFNYYAKPLNLQSTLSFYKKRSLYIILPYFIFSVGYFLLIAYIYPPVDIGQAVNTFVKQFLTGTVFYHLYFMFIIVQFYIVFPILLRLVKIKWIAQTSFLWGLLIQFAFVFYGDPIIKLLHLENGSTLFPTYFAYFMLGAYLGIFYDKAERFLNITTYALFSKKGILAAFMWAAWLITGLYYVYIMYMGRAYNVWADSLVFKLTWPLFSMLSALVLFQLAFWLWNKGKARLVNPLIHIGITSFGIYLIHPFVLFVYNRFTIPGNAALFHTKIIAGFFIVFVISWFVTGWLMKHVKWSAFLFGAAPQNPPYKNRENNET